MEPTLSTAPDLVPILNELMRREPIFHHPEFGTSKADFEAMTDPEFWEVGASGRRYSRTYCISGSAFPASHRGLGRKRLPLYKNLSRQLLGNIHTDTGEHPYHAQIDNLATSRR